MLLAAAALLSCASGLSAVPSAASAKTPQGVVGTPAAAATPTAPSVNPDIEVSATLQRQLAAHGKADFAIEFSERPDLSAAYAKPWVERGRYVYERLRATAEHSQAATRRLLQARGVAFEPHWIKNTILVRQGDMATLSAASRLDGVLRIRDLPKTRFMQPEPAKVQARAPSTDGIGDNIRWIGAPQAWAQGVTGNGVTVGTIDNGVLYTHSALVDHYRGNHGGIFDHDYNWFAPGVHTPAPQSFLDPHGTHVIGSIVGDDRNPDPAQRNRIGVAPGAQWISCLGMPMDGDPGFNLLTCGEFMLAPTKTDGTAANPDLRPQVVNNSWSEGTCNGTTTPFYADVVESWVAAGIFPVFAAGNTFSCGLPEPPSLSTVSSPASLASAFAVGSSGNHDGQYAPHSLWGPTTASSPGLPHYPDPRGFPQLKPQVVAPGADIRSASDASPTGYVTMTGTSMSSPQLTGLVALMLDAGECLRGDYATLGTMIMQTARPIPYETGGSPPPGPGNVPNYATGWGEIDVPAAVAAASNACGPQGLIAGRITSAGGAPVAGAKVEVFVDPAVRIYQASTETDGSFMRRMPQRLSGGYTVRVSAYGYLPSSEAGVLVGNGATTQHDVQLAPATTYKISGQVTDAATGWPLHARVRISGYPGAAIWTDPSSGRYSVRLPEGTPYRFDVDTDVPGYAAASRDVTSLNSGAAQNFALQADPIACAAPGYRFSSTLLSEDFENAIGAPPAGWSRSSAGLGWLFGSAADLSSTSFQIPAHGRFAAANDELGAGDGWDNDGRRDMLVMPALDLAALAAPVLRYSSFVLDENPRATVEASTDGGATWSTLGTPHRTDATRGWTREAISLTPVAASAGNVLIRFHADDGTTDDSGMQTPGWAIDDVAVTSGCNAPTQGGLVVGRVRDANTGAPLNGAAISVDDVPATTSSRSIDDAVGDGFYAVYAPAGAPQVKAAHGALAAAYGDASATPAVVSGTTTVSDLALTAGRLRLYPSAPAGTVELGSTASVPFTVTNSGTRALSFGFEQAAIEEHFEGTAFPPPGWDVHNSGAGTAAACGWQWLDPQRSVNYAGGDGRAAMVSLFSCNAAADSALITPAIDLSRSHTASMGFFLAFSAGVPESAARFEVDATRDGGASWTNVLTQTSDVSAYGPGALVELDLTPFVGSSSVRVRFRFSAQPPYSGVVVDQVHLFNGVGMSSMLALTPDAGALAAGESRTLDALFDARAIAQPGTYTLPVRVAQDTPYPWPFGDVEATMTVTAPASYGSIGGTVRSLGYCDAHPAALADLTVTISGGGQSFTAKTAADGSYRYWVEAARGPFTVSVGAPGHVTSSRQIAVAAGAQAGGDFDLRSEQPCLITDPAAPSASVPSGQNLQQPFTLMNAGAGAADWTLRAGGDPSALSLVPLSQTTSATPLANASFGCVAPGTPYVFDSRYLRVFPLAERGLPNQPVLVSGLSFAVDSAISPQGSQPITLRLYSLSGELKVENMQLLREKTIAVADGSLQPVSATFDQPLSVPGDTVLVAEIHVPGDGRDTTFYPGGNKSGQSAPGYWIAPNCGVDEPMAFGDVSHALEDTALILQIDTQASDPCGAHATPVGWLGVSQASGHLGGDSSLPLQARFDAAGRADGDYQGSMCITPGQGTAAVAVPVTLHVGASGDVIFRNGFD